MSNDKIAEIRERHARDAEWSGGWAQICPRTHDDRATLLAEVEKLTRERDEARVEVERLRAQVAEYFTEPATHPVEREE